jgi:SM-20-related protein
MAYLDIEAFKATAKVADPFDFIIVPAFLSPDRLDDVNGDFPAIEQAGNFPLEELRFGPHFSAFIDEIKGPAFRAAIEEKFGLDLAGLKHVVTVRALSQKSDGNIHTDAPSKVVTALIYLNQNWDSEGGRLRLLRNERDFDDYIAEVPPIAGTLLLFKRSDNSWHGHKPFVGARRTIQINWVSEAADQSLQHYRVGQAKRRVLRWFGLGA